MQKKTNHRKSGSEHDSELTLLRDINRSLQVLVGLTLESVRGERGQKDMVLLLDSIGCGHVEIADILGISRNSVGPALTRGRRATKKRR
jgi:DNA-directed RNA polymerase specialized sigma24 family protein